MTFHDFWSPLWIPWGTIFGETGCLFRGLIFRLCLHHFLEGPAAGAGSLQASLCFQNVLIYHITPCTLKGGPNLKASPRRRPSVTRQLLTGRLLKWVGHRLNPKL